MVAHMVLTPVPGNQTPSHSGKTPICINQKYFLIKIKMIISHHFTHCLLFSKLTLESWFYSDSLWKVTMLSCTVYKSKESKLHRVACTSNPTLRREYNWLWSHPELATYIVPGHPWLLIYFISEVKDKIKIRTVTVSLILSLRLRRWFRGGH